MDARIAACTAGVSLLLTGCSGTQQGTPATTPGVESPASVSATPSSSPVKPQTAEDKRIIKGKEAIRLYNQTILDIYAAPNPRIDDMHEVAYGQALLEGMKSITQGLENGWSATSGMVDVVWVEPVSAKREKMILFACVDRSAVLGGRDDQPKTPYDRGAGDYWIERVQGRWLVTRTVLHGDATEVTPC